MIGPNRAEALNYSTVIFGLTQSHLTKVWFYIIDFVASPFVLPPPLYEILV